jgi:hypothetical protein
MEGWKEGWKEGRKEGIENNDQHTVYKYGACLDYPSI